MKKMLFFSTWVISLLILPRAILAEDSVWYDKLYHHASHDRVHTSRTGRFGFGFLENLRKNFCQSQFCMSADTMPYFINLMCAIKCPDLYLPHHPTPENITSTSISTPFSTIKTTAKPPAPIAPMPAQSATVAPAAAQPPATTAPTVVQPLAAPAPAQPPAAPAPAPAQPPAAPAQQSAE